MKRKGLSSKKIRKANRVEMKRLKRDSKLRTKEVAREARHLAYFICSSHSFSDRQGIGTHISGTCFPEEVKELARKFVQEIMIGNYKGEKE